jgi:hypothetical protein
MLEKLACLLLSGAPSPGVEWLAHEADHSPPYDTKVKNVQRSTSTLWHTFEHGA